MLKLTAVVLVVVLAGTANAAGWRKLQIDASSEAAFAASVARFHDKLTPSRREAFARSLQDVWIAGTRSASAEQREYTSDEYRRQLDGLTYDQVVTLTDPTGGKAARYRREYYARAAGGTPQGGGNPLWVDNSFRSTDRVPYRGGTDLFGSGADRH